MYRLMIKTSNQGLKYLCVSKQDDYEIYKGSGRDWIKHLDKYGYDITTEVLFETESDDELTEIGLFYSNLYNIVESEDWANVVKEEGYRYFNKFNHWCIYDNNVTEKISQSQIDMFENMTPEEKLQYTSKWRDGFKNWFKSLSIEEYDKYCEKLSVAQKKFYSSLDESGWAKISEKNRNSRLNLSEESKKERKRKIQEVYATKKHQNIFDRYSEERQGKNNPNAKVVIADGVKYECIKDACEALNITRRELGVRLNSEKYHNYSKI